MLKKRLAVFMVMVMFFTNINFSFANSRITDEQYSKIILSQIYQINKLLQPYGLGLEDLQKLEEKDEQFYQELDALMKAKLTTQDVLKIDEIKNSSNNKTTYEEYIQNIDSEFIEESDRWAYAKQKAELNIKNDRNAKDIVKETTYMYMSHFIDIRDGVIKKVDRAYLESYVSNDGYLARWITNDDRRVYETYIDGMKIADRLSTSSKIITDLTGFALSLRQMKAEKNADSYIDVLSMLTKDDMNSLMGDLVSLGMTTKESIDIINSSSTAKSAMERIEKCLASKYTDGRQIDYSLKFIRDVSIAYVTGGLSSAFKSITLSGVKLTIDIYKDFFDRVWWIAMLTSNSMRVSNRFMRSMGWF